METLYVTALQRELIARRHKVEREVGVQATYDGVELGFQRLDLIVDDMLVVETKSTAELHKHATRQVYNCLRATNREVGLLMDFGPEHRFFRVVCQNRVPESPPFDPSG